VRRGNFFLTALFWVQCFALKGVFDYYVIFRPVVGPIKVIIGAPSICES
jgi:hypothetical protein